MGTKERRAREREETRTKILDAAREMFAAEGVEAVTMRAIAERIEYTPTAIYHHFRDKQTLLAELCAVDFRSLAGAFNRIGRIADPVERLRRIGMAYVEFALGYPSHYRFMFMTPKPLDADTIASIHGNPEEDAYVFLRETVAEGIAAGRYRPELSDAEELAQIMWGGVHGIVSMHIAKGNDEWIQFRDPRATAWRIIDVQLRGVLADPSDPVLAIVTGSDVLAGTRA
jgi:AcrR family transcriptional regulator